MHEIMDSASTHELPKDFRLLPGESIIEPIVTYEHHRPDRSPSSTEQMIRLTHAQIADEIGKFGPSDASTTFDTSAPDHLKLYETLFGRDSLRTAIDLIDDYPLLARTTVLELARLQGVDYNMAREEEPGRIVHEARSPDDPIAQRLTEERGWGWPYYGSVDATPNFVRTLTAYCQLSEENRAFLAEHYTDRNGDDQTISHALEMAIRWIEHRLSMNPEGLLEFKSEIATGIENQVWKDSWDAYHHSDGTMANHSKGIASIEVQVATYDALIDAAELFEDILDQPERATSLRATAEKLKATILDTFWTDEKGGYFVLGTDRDDDNNLRQLKIRTSNMGHVLNSRLLDGNDPAIVCKRNAVIEQLFTPQMLNHSGIRTLASDEYRFRPGAYHNGSVWLWDTYFIAKGLRRHGHVNDAASLTGRLLRVIDETHLFPEYVRGDSAHFATVNTQSILLWDEINHRENQVEQPPQEVQAWTVAAILAIRRRLSRAQFIDS